MSRLQKSKKTAIVTRHVNSTSWEANLNSTKQVSVGERWGSKIRFWDSLAPSCIPGNLFAPSYSFSAVC